MGEKSRGNNLDGRLFSVGEKPHSARGLTFFFLIQQSSAESGPLGGNLSFFKKTKELPVDLPASRLVWPINFRKILPRSVPLDGEICICQSRSVNYLPNGIAELYFFHSFKKASPPLALICLALWSLGIHYEINLLAHCCSSQCT